MDRDLNKNQPLGTWSYYLPNSVIDKRQLTGALFSDYKNDV